MNKTIQAGGTVIGVLTTENFVCPGILHWEIVGIEGDFYVTNIKMNDSLVMVHRQYATSYKQAAIETRRDVIRRMAVEGLVTDGALHKQWFLEEIFKLTGGDIANLHTKGIEWEEGVAP